MSAAVHFKGRFDRVVKEEATKINYLAIDIGASSGRHMLSSVRDGRITIEEIYRFPNQQLRRGGHDCWDIENLWRGVVEGLIACKARGRIPDYIGIDTWGVDFVLLDGEGKPLGDAVSYRDSRTRGMDEIAGISRRELYARTGIQFQPFNTLYQLLALRREHPEQIERAESLLMIPDMLSALLTGEMRQEYTNATTTGLVNARDRCWDRQIIERLGLPGRQFKPLSMPGDVVGELSPPIRERVGFNSRVVLPATHDTGSAFLAVPARDERSVFLSSGTWSLLGAENAQPITSEESREANFTNEGGAFNTYRYLKNIMGLWMIQCVRRELSGTAYVAGTKSAHADGRQWSFEELSGEARKAEDFVARVNTDDPRFLSPASMIDAVREACEEARQRIPQTVGEIMRTLYLSLATDYRDAIGALDRLTGIRHRDIHIVGGGCQDDVLNQLTANITGLPVYAGPVEGTAIGNLLVQMIAGGEFRDLREARDAVRESFFVREYDPQTTRRSCDVC